MKRNSTSLVKLVETSNIHKTSKSLEMEKYNRIVFQHNNLIEAKYSLTLQEKRIIMWLAAQVQSEDEDFKSHILYVKDLANIIGLKGESIYNSVKKITYNMLQRRFKIIDLTRRRETQLNWLAYADYFDETGKVHLGFSPQLKPYLLQLKEKFTSFRVSDLMKFSSIHAIRIYELLKQYEHLGQRQLSIIEIRQICSVENKLKSYVEFERRILLISKREINNKSDIVFEYEKVKQGRKIVAIKFDIGKNANYKEDISLKSLKAEDKKSISISDVCINKIKRTLEEFGLSHRRINSLVFDNTTDDIQNAIETVRIQIKKSNVFNPKGMLLTAIKEKWRPGKYLKR